MRKVSKGKTACVTRRAEETKSFIVFDIYERAYQMEREGRKPILLSVGEPDFRTPEAVVEAAKKALLENRATYTHSLGIIELREAIAADYHKQYDVNIDPGRIMVCSGTSPAMLMLFGVLIESDDNVILPNPYYPCYPNFIKFLGGKVNLVDVHEEDGFQYRIKDLKAKINNRTAAIMLNSPSNPTGTLMPPERMKEMVRLGPPVISDEIYHGLVYGERAHSIFEFDPDAFVLNGFSKRYAMTGWRLGYLVAPQKFMAPLQRMQQNFQISVNTFAQYGAVAALTDPSVEQEVNRMVNILDQRRRYLLDRLKKMGFGIATEPKGAFYVFVNAKRFTHDTYKFAFDLVEKAEVGVTPGIDFGPAGEGFLRFSYANSMENIEEGLNRLEKYLADMEEN